MNQLLQVKVKILTCITKIVLKKTSLLRIFPVILNDENNIIERNKFLDNDFNTTLLSAVIQEKINLNRKHQNLNMIFTLGKQ